MCHIAAYAPKSKPRTHLYSSQVACALFALRFVAHGESNLRLLVGRTVSVVLALWRKNNKTAKKPVSHLQQKVTKCFNNSNSFLFFVWATRAPTYLHIQSHTPNNEMCVCVEKKKNGALIGFLLICHKCHNWEFHFPLFTASWQQPYTLRQAPQTTTHAYECDKIFFLASVCIFACVVDSQNTLECY